MVLTVPSQKNGMIHLSSNNKVVTAGAYTSQRTTMLFSNFPCGCEKQPKSSRVHRATGWAPIACSNIAYQSLILSQRKSIEIEPTPIQCTHLLLVTLSATLLYPQKIYPVPFPPQSVHTPMLLLPMSWRAMSTPTAGLQLRRLYLQTLFIASAHGTCCL